MFTILSVTLMAVAALATALATLVAMRLRLRRQARAQAAARPAPSAEVPRPAPVVAVAEAALAADAAVAAMPAAEPMAQPAASSGAEPAIAARLDELRASVSLIAESQAAILGTLDQLPDVLPLAALPSTVAGLTGSLESLLARVDEMEAELAAQMRAIANDKTLPARIGAVETRLKAMPGELTTLLEDLDERGKARSAALEKRLAERIGAVSAPDDLARPALAQMETRIDARIDAGLAALRGEVAATAAALSRRGDGLVAAVQLVHGELRDGLAALARPAFPAGPLSAAPVAAVPAPAAPVAAAPASDAAPPVVPVPQHVVGATPIARLSLVATDEDGTAAAPADPAAAASAQPAAPASLQPHAPAPDAVAAEPSESPRERMRRELALMKMRENLAEMLRAPAAKG